METFYDGDLKDIWDSDLDPSDSLKLSTDSDMHDWFLEKDVRDGPVILNDKLISDALLNGTLPIKSEHSYSLSSDGDSLPDSPASLNTRIDDMEDECYPAISLKTATSNIRAPSTPSLINDDHNMDPKLVSVTTNTSINNHIRTTATGFNLQNLMQTSPANAHNTNGYLTSLTSTSKYAGLCKLAAGPIKLSLRSIDHANHQQTITDIKLMTDKQQRILQAPQQQQQQQQQQHQYLPQKSIASATAMDNDGESNSCSREATLSPDICSDIEIDESCVKNEPLSPGSSCPPSPETAEFAIKKSSTNSTLSLTMANMAAFTNSDLVFEHRNGCLQLTPSSQNLLKTQQIILTANPQNVIVPKLNIKTENTGATTFVPTTSSSLTNGNTNNNNNNNNSSTYGLPLTPPSSLSSEGSEGNLTPEHQLSPLSPATSATNANHNNNNNNTLRSVAASTTQSTNGILTVTTMRRATQNNITSFSNNSTMNFSSNSLGRHNNGGTTRQPIHTPLISSQPKGSTGTLMLTEEEKRTLLAEGYPIPQKLPLTKAEEKSLKKIRRKIKNKISAQESRRKKKEYMDQLERKVEILVNENSEYKKRVQTLEDTNANLLSQLHKLQALVNKNTMKIS